MKTEVLHSTDFIAKTHSLSRGEIIKRTIWLKIKPVQRIIHGGGRRMQNMYTQKQIDQILCWPYQAEV